MVARLCRQLVFLRGRSGGGWWWSGGGGGGEGLELITGKMPDCNCTTFPARKKGGKLNTDWIRASQDVEHKMPGCQMNNGFFPSNEWIGQSKNLFQFSSYSLDAQFQCCWLTAEMEQLILMNRPRKLSPPKWQGLVWETCASTLSQYCAA